MAKTAILASAGKNFSIAERQLLIRCAHADFAIEQRAGGHYRQQQAVTTYRPQQNTRRRLKATKLTRQKLTKVAPEQMLK